MSNYSIGDKVIIVTGATKGMGFASSKQLLKLGAKVVMVYFSDTVNARQIEAELSNDHKSQILHLKADITKAADRQRIVDETLTAFHEINVLVNNAGIPAKASFLKEIEEDFDIVVDVNLKAPIFLAKLVAEQMIKQKKGGSIINFSYAIRANSISPGTHKTEMNRMDKNDRIRACYLHACLKYVTRDYMTNSSLRERFGIEPKNSAIASRIIKDALEAELIHPYDIRMPQGNTSNMIIIRRLLCGVTTVFYRTARSLLMIIISILVQHTLEISIEFVALIGYNILIRARGAQ